ncbi:MAG: IPT/TIG domain-containing protein [Candidatus Pseudobacter hemicellulosilyticus]|uniref:IPT/TIG domain-containing protein n=1 Tax=Candidatus Pseudobacter hemicellulosilyticus TaxID=3121375 RepID=A0AAJ5WXY3_9BACT|nr:MAG: IPT/TIG domain-containing protein [Pseudobacter sp.]
MKSTILFLAVGLLTLTACEKEQHDEAAVLSVEQPVISKVDRSIVQAGDTIVITGTALQQEDRSTELSVSGRPAKIVTISADKITALVPDNAFTGKVMITISGGRQFAVGYGPELNVKGTPRIISYSPVYAFEGDEVTLVVNNFSADNADNSIYLDGRKVEIVYNNKVDTLKVLIPAGASNAVFEWSTYGGPAFKSASPYLVRKKDYPVSSILEWVDLDPAFTLNKVAMNHPNTINFKPAYEPLEPYLKGGKSGAIFLADNEGFAAINVFNEADLINKNILLNAFWMPNRYLAAILPGFGGPETLVEGKQETALNQQIVLPNESWASPDKKNYVQLSKVGEDWTIQALTYWGPLGNKQKIRYIRQIGQMHLYQITGVLHFDSDY